MWKKRSDFWHTLLSPNLRGNANTHEAEQQSRAPHGWLPWRRGNSALVGFQRISSMSKCFCFSWYGDMRFFFSYNLLWVILYNVDQLCIPVINPKRPEYIIPIIHGWRHRTSAYAMLFMVTFIRKTACSFLFVYSLYLVLVLPRFMP